MAETEPLFRVQRPCGWCDRPLPEKARKDAKYCKTGCRQAAHRVKKLAIRREAGGEPIRVGYADPPYIGMSARYYRDHPHFAGEVDHEALVKRLVVEFPEGWALSLSAASLAVVLELCTRLVPDKGKLRVAAWFRGERPTASYKPLSAWEPVIFYGGREVYAEPGDRRVDALVAHARPRTTDPKRVVGQKPAKFCWWLFDLLGLRPGDELVDLFPGSGGIAWAFSALNDERPASELPTYVYPPCDTGTPESQLSECNLELIASAMVNHNG